MPRKQKNQWVRKTAADVPAMDDMVALVSDAALFAAGGGGRVLHRLPVDLDRDCPELATFGHLVVGGPQDGAEHIWEAVVADVCSGATGCPQCPPGGTTATVPLVRHRARLEGVPDVAEIDPTIEYDPAWAAEAGELLDWYHDTLVAAMAPPHDPT